MVLIDFILLLPGGEHGQGVGCWTRNPEVLGSTPPSLPLDGFVFGKPH